MQSSFDKEYNVVFAVDKDSISRIFDLLKSKICDPEIKIECIDNTTHVMTSVAKLFDYANARDKRIKKLTISAFNFSPSRKSASVTFNDKNALWRGISIRIEARNDVVDRMKNDLFDIIDGVKPWYHHAPKFNFVAIGLFLVFFTSLAVSVLKKLGYITLTENKGFDISEFNLFMMATLLYVVVLYFLNLIRDFIFPRAVFLIGNEIKRYDTIIRVQWGVIISGIVAIVTGVLVTFFS
ncbi:MAG: hypothetical protein NXI29_05580 [bacterium]|nr:hypothetical protein [bacterium]